MILNKPITAKAIAEKYNLNVLGDENRLVKSIREINKIEAGSLTYVDHPKWYNKALTSLADVILINKPVNVPEGKTLLVADSPFDVFNDLALNLRPFKNCEQLHSSSIEVGENTIIQPNVFIGNNVKIGKNCIIFSGVSIYDYSEIGDDVIIHSNSLIGSDAFYYKQREKGNYSKMHTVGRAIIENNVEIGANCNIASGVSGDTIIGEGTKIDALCQIGHGAVLGKHCLLASQVGIAGKAKIGNYVKLYGKVGVIQGVTIGDKAVVLASSGVGGDLEGGKTYFGAPAIDARQRWKEMMYVRQLGKIWDRLILKPQKDL